MKATWRRIPVLRNPRAFCPHRRSLGPRLGMYPSKSGINIVQMFNYRLRSTGSKRGVLK